MEPARSDTDRRFCSDAAALQDTPAHLTEDLSELCEPLEALRTAA